MVNKSESISNYPFPTDLHEKSNVVEGAFASIKEFANDPAWVVKEYRQVNDAALDDWLYENDGEYPEEPPEMTFTRFYQEVKRHKVLIDASKSGIKGFIPRHYLVYGDTDRGDQAGFIVMQKVEGRDISELTKITAEQLQDLERLLITSLDFYEESKTLPQKGTGVYGYFPDLITDSTTKIFDPSEFVLHNIMFGTTADNPDASIYLVDSYPLIAIYKNDSVPPFNNLKEALLRFEMQTDVRFSSALTLRLAKYGTKPFEHARKVSQN